MPTKFGLVLGAYLQSTGGSQAQLAREIGTDPGTVSRIINGETSKTEWLAPIVAHYESEPDIQADLVAAYCFDQLPRELTSQFEVKLRIGGMSGEFNPPLDEFEATLQRLALFADNSGVRAMVIALNKVLDEFDERRERTGI
jgi:transcriptional regulator with XRE-family HTH domain